MFHFRKTTIIRWLGAGLSALLFVVCGVGPRSWAGPVEKAKAKPAPPAAAYSAEDIAAFSARFQRELWPLLTRKESGCAGCHNAGNPSQLRITGDPEALFKVLLSDGHFDPENAASLLARVTAPAGTTHMPPAPFAAWSEADIGLLRAFVNDLYAKRHKGGTHADERFPVALTTPFAGKRASGGTDNTFLTYYQLRGKVKAIFDDDWHRDGKDLFEENLGQFGGADFVLSFNENARPTAQFLSGVDTLSKDVAARAYLASTGPFAGRAPSLPSPMTMKGPDAAYVREIDRLYQKLLFRPATPQELLASFRFLQDIYRVQKDLGSRDYDLRFALTARDPQGLTTTQPITMHVGADGYGLGQTLVDENSAAAHDEKTKLAKCRLAGPYTFKAGDAEQRVTVYNAGTRGNVLVHGIEVHGPLPDGPTRMIPITDPAVQPQGAWRMTQQDGVPCYEDGNQNKGASSLVIPLKVDKDGPYEVSLAWRSTETTRNFGGKRRGFSAPNAENVLVEVRSYDKSRLVAPSPPPVPPRGEARFTMDQSDDTVQFWNAATPFRFGEGDGVEITNGQTRGRVVADAVKFSPVVLPGVKTASSDATTFFVPAKSAQGQEQWKDYVRGQYTFYRPVGPRVVSDESDPTLKGKLSLYYRPAVRADDWKPGSFYRVEIGYPGAVQNDSSVPVTIRAKESAPILRVVHPVHAHVGGVMTLDATGSYNTQQTPLQLTWRQIDGAQAPLADPHAARLRFTLPALSAQETAWEGLCRALMKHPDFLFTRPLSLATTRDPKVRQRLQLVKIAQDLVGRTPTAAELAKLDRGASLAALVDAYLATREFQDFYFHRIRLYLESHGTEEDDEPVRLWSSIAFDNRSFKEILTADYTVDADGKRQSRPDYYGKSGVLTMKGFIKGKPGLPHFNYAAQVCEKFLGYVFEVPAEIVKMRDGITAASTTSPSGVCYACHKILTPLAYQRTQWTDTGLYQPKDDRGRLIDASDHQLVPSYPFKGSGMEAFALQAQNKERFVRTILQTHFIFYFGREMRYDKEERGLYRRLWETEKANGYRIKGLIRALLTSPEYLNGGTQLAPSAGPKRPAGTHSRALARLTRR
jgi:hypothetical protein